MASLSVGNVVFVSFPFSDLTNTKLRPAILLAYVGRDDWILCQVTSKPYADKQAIELSEACYELGGLNQLSYARSTKLFTANQSIIKKQVGRLNKQTFKKISSTIQETLEEELNAYNLNNQ